VPNAQGNKDESKHVLLAGTSGVGKSTLAYYAPQPIASLLLDKSSLDVPPGADAASIFYKTYPPAMVDLTNDTHGRARNIADQIIRDIQLFRDHFTIKKKLQISSGVDSKTTEEWPTPKTIVLEGGDFLAQHILNLVCARHKKNNPSDFDNPFEAWGLRLVELHAIYDMLTYLPCNVIVTTGIHKETKTSRVNGKVASEETGVCLPDLGGAMCAEGPRKFHTSLYVYAENGKHYVRTRSNVKFQGFKIGGKFGASELIDITLGASTPNPWQKLFE
jgi:AAA domain